MSKITSIQILSGYRLRLRLRFSDGFEGTVDLSDEMHGQIFGPLKDPALFAQAAIDSFGGVFWPNKADICPGYLRELAI